MRLRNALAIGVTAATIAPAVLTGSAATAAASLSARAAVDSVARGDADAMPGPAAGAVARAGAGPAVVTVTAGEAADVIAKPGADAMARPAAGRVARPGAKPIAVPPARPAAKPPARAGDSPGPSSVAASPSPSVAEPRPQRGPGQPEDRQPSCGKASDPDFPIDTRIHGGPEVHHPGGDSRRWSVDLTNTTDDTCHNIHPVIIFVARDPGLTPSLIQLEFFDKEANRWHPVVLETTAEDEIVGVLEGPGFRGFAVPARKSLTVDVRLALAADTGPNEVTVNAAIVQRQGDDGDWVGESGDYRFTVVEDDGSGSIVTFDTFDELATTGTNSVFRLVVGVGAVILGGAALVLAARRFRAGRR